MFYTPVNAVLRNSTSTYQIRVHALDEWASILDVLYGSKRTKHEII